MWSHLEFLWKIKYIRPSLIKTTPLLLTPGECKEKGGGFNQTVFALNIYKYKGSLLTEKYLTEELPVCNYQFGRKICEKTLEILFMRRHIPLSYFPIYSEYVHLFNYSSFVSQTLSD